MILCDSEIIELAEKGMIKPFNKDNVNPASYNLTLGSGYRIPECTYIGEGRWSEEMQMPKEGIDLSETPLILAHSLEFTVLPDDVSAMLFSRSTTGRKAIEHLHAGWGECGFPGQWTFEIHNLWPFKRIIKPGDLLFQLVFCRMSKKPEKNYRQKEGSHYINQKGAKPNYNQKE